MGNVGLVWVSEHCDVRLPVPRAFEASIWPLTYTSLVQHRLEVASGVPSGAPSATSAKRLCGRGVIQPVVVTAREIVSADVPAARAFDVNFTREANEAPLNT